MPGPTSKLSRDLANVQADLRTGKTRAKTPRDFTPEEIRAKEALRDRLKKQMRENAAQRAIRRINEHTTTEADRVIEAQGQQINDATADSRTFFASVNGAGSSTELRTQRAVLSVKIKEQDKKERAEKKRCEGAARPSTTTTTPTSNNNPMPAKRRRTSKQSESSNRDNRDNRDNRASAATTQATRAAQSPIRPTAAAVPPAEAGGLVAEINGLRLAFLPLPAAADLLEFCKSKLSDACRIHTGQFKTLSRQAAKLFCYDVDAEGWAPQYKFADMAPKDYHLRHSGIRSTPLEHLVRHVCEAYGVEVNHIVINCYPSKADYIPSHKDQPLSTASASNRYETKESVFVYCLGAERPLCFLRDDGGKQLWGKKLRSEMDILCELKTVHNSLYRLTGPVNEACLHCVPVEPSEGKAEELRFSITLRGAHRLKVNAEQGTYMSFNGKKWETRDLPQRAVDVD